MTLQSVDKCPKCGNPLATGLTDDFKPEGCTKDMCQFGHSSVQTPAKWPIQTDMGTDGSRNKIAPVPAAPELCPTCHAPKPCPITNHYQFAPPVAASEEPKLGASADEIVRELAGRNVQAFAAFDSAMGRLIVVAKHYVRLQSVASSGEMRLLSISSVEELIAEIRSRYVEVASLRSQLEEVQRQLQAKDECIKYEMAIKTMAQDQVKAAEQSLSTLQSTLIEFVSAKEPNGYPLWFNREVHECRNCDSEDLCRKHHDMAHRGFTACEKNIEKFVAAIRSKYPSGAKE